MRKKDVEKMLKNELGEITPDVYGKIMPAEACESENSGGVLAKKKKLFIGFNAAIAALLVVFLAIWLLWPAGGDKINFGNGGFVFIDINPSVQFSVDGNGNVKKITPLNEDARIMIGGRESEFVGKSAETASSMLFDAAQRLGYFKVDKKTNALLVSSSLGNEKEEEKLNGRLKQAFKDSFVSAGMYGVVITGADSSALKAEADAHGITQSKMRLISNAVSLGAVISPSEYGSISVAEIYERIEARAEEAERFGGEDILEEYEDYEELIEERLEQFGETLETLTEKLAEYIEDYSEEADFDKDTQKKLERIAEELEELSEEVSDGIEDGKNVKKLLEKLDGKLAEIIFLAPELGDKVSQFKGETDELLAGYDRLAAQAEEAKAEILNARLERMQNYSQNYNDGFNRKKFEKQYEEWLVDNEDYYESHWDELKILWERED